MVVMRTSRLDLLDHVFVRVAVAAQRLDAGFGRGIAGFGRHVLGDGAFGVQAAFAPASMRSAVSSI